MATREYFNYDKAVDTCRDLSNSQGMYGRILNALLKFNEEQIQNFNNEMQKNKIYDMVDFVMYIEQ